MPQNPYYIQPASGLPGFKALQEGIGTRIEYERGKTEEARKQGIRQEAQQAQKTEDYDKLSDIYAKNPWAVEETKKSMGHINELTEKNMLDSLRKIVIGGEPMSKVAIERVEFVLNQGGDAEGSINFAQIAQEDPESAMQIVKNLYAAYASPEEWKAYREATGAEGTSEKYTPTQLGKFAKERRELIDSGISEDDPLVKAYDRKIQGSGEDDTPASVAEWKFYNSLPKKQKNEYLSMKRAQPTINLGGSVVQPSMTEPGVIAGEFEKTIPPERLPENVAAEKEAAESGRAIGEINMKQYEAATAASESLVKIDELISHIEESEAITGLGAEVFKNIERVRTLIGSEVAAGTVTDTEILDAMMGAEVFPLIKSLGVGARGLDTPAEREFMRSVLTGSIKLNKETLLKMAQTRKNIAQRAIDKWDKRTKSGELDNFYKYTGIQKPKEDTRPPSELSDEELMNRAFGGR